MFDMSDMFLPVSDHHQRIYIQHAESLIALHLYHTWEYSIKSYDVGPQLF